MPTIRTKTAIAALALAMLANGAAANEPFYKGKRLSVLINYGAGGPADIEGRLFARHIGKYIDGNPNVIVQNIDGAGGLIGTTYLGEVAPKDGTMMGHLTGVGWRWAFDSERFRVDFGTYEFLGYQTSTTVAFMRTDVPPGIKAATDIIKVQSLISGGLGPDNAKDLAIRLSLDLLGIPHRHVTSYRSSAHARLALQQGEINFYSESPPSYRAVVHPGIVKEGLAIPVWHEAERGGRRREAGCRSPDRAVRRSVQGGEGQSAGRAAVGRVPDGADRQRHHDPHSGLAAGRAEAGGRRVARRRWRG